MLPQKILKCRCSETQFLTFWISNSVVFMKICVAMWRLISVGRIGVLLRLTLRVRSVKTGNWDGAYGFSFLSEKTRMCNHLQMGIKDSTFYSVMLRPWVLVRKVIEPGPSGPKSSTQPVEPISRRFWRTLPLQCCLVSAGYRRSTIIYGA